MPAGGRLCNGDGFYAKLILSWGGDLAMIKRFIVTQGTERPWAAAFATQWSH